MSNESLFRFVGVALMAHTRVHRLTNIFRILANCEMAGMCLCILNKILLEERVTDLCLYSLTGHTRTVKYFYGI